MICECYRAEKNFLGKIGLCLGTQERDACSCGGDKSNCDFYPSVREEEKKPITRADRIRTMNDEELAEFIVQLAGRSDCYESEYDDYKKEWLDWLEEDIEDAGDQ